MRSVALLFLLALAPAIAPTPLFADDAEETEDAGEGADENKDDSKEEAKHEGGWLTNTLLPMTSVGAEWVLWLLVLLSILSIAVIVERILYNVNHKVDGEQLGQQVEQLLGEGNIRGVWDLVNESDCIEHEVVAAGLPALQRGTAACSEAMLSAKARLKSQVDARLSILATIGSNAPFVGLLGTVLGIVKAAKDLSGGDPNAVMAGVFEALVATAVGLFVAIPAVVAFNLFNRKVKNTIAQVDSLMHLVLAHVKVEKKASAAPAPAAAARSN